MYINVGISKNDGVPHITISTDYNTFKKKLIKKNKNGEQHLATEMSCAFATTTALVGPTLDFLRECRITAPSKQTLNMRRNKVRKQFEGNVVRRIF